MAIIILSIALFAETVALVVLALKMKKAQKTDIMKEARKEFKSAMVNLRRLERLLETTSRK